ncbi:MAG: hypothetical protein Q6J46_04130 [Thermostichus sp. DG02_2_bins_29]
MPRIPIYAEDSCNRLSRSRETYYEAVLQDINRQKNPVEQLFILGDVIGPTSESERLIERLQNPKSGELKPQLCLGWWEEQALILHGLGRTGDPVELRQQQGSAAIEKLWKAISKSTLHWIRSWDFGIQELDCLLIHGSTLSVSEALTPSTPPWQLWDRVARAEVNTLFCGRSGQAFHLQLQGGSVHESLMTLQGSQPEQAKTVTPKQVIGVGSVGKVPQQATYTLYDPGSGRVQFQQVHYGTSGRGFAPR